MDDLATILARFATWGFTTRERICELGAPSTGRIRNMFFENRLYKFGDTDQPYPSPSPSPTLISICNNTHSPSPSPSPSLSPSSPSSSKNRQEQAMKMDYEGAASGFDCLYYCSVLHGRGILFVDQQLTSGEQTASWVRRCASDVSLFHSDFGNAMMKLSSTNVVARANGNVRRTCRKADSSLW